MRGVALDRFLALVLFAVLLASSWAHAQEKRRQATGTVAASTPTQLVLLKQFGRNFARWNFAISPKTKQEGKLAKGERIRIYYHQDKAQRVADEIKILEAASPTASPATNKAAAVASPPQQPH